MRWDEPEAQGSGYIALFSARGLRTTPADPATPPPNGDDNSKGWGHKELIADGHDNVWVTIVGDQATYGSFKKFVAAVRECKLDASIDDGTCSIEVPARPNAHREDRSVLEVSWDDGATLDGQPHDELKGDGWPRFSFRVMDRSNQTAPFSIAGAAGIANTVAWGDESWTITATVDVPNEAPGTAPGGTRRQAQLTLLHDFSDLDHPVRTVTNLPPTSPLVPTDALDLDAPVALGASTAGPQPLPPAQSRLGLEFRSQRRASVASPRRSS
jgi:hypothetical protein